MKSDKRNNPRQNFVKKVTLVTLKERVYIYQSENLSMSGIFLESEKPLPPGTEGFLSMIVKNNSNMRKINTRFRVVHNHPGTGGAAGMGVEFVDVENEFRSLLKEMLL